MKNEEKKLKITAILLCIANIVGLLIVSYVFIDLVNKVILNDFTLEKITNDELINKIEYYIIIIFIFAVVVGYLLRDFTNKLFELFKEEEPNLYKTIIEQVLEAREKED